MQKGNIGVTTENIFPIIKKFLYSDHEIFLRELVSNAVDATQKLNTLASIGEFKGELGDLTIHVELGKDTITISDHGIGLTAEEIEKYINQIAFSGANDFLEKYKKVLKLGGQIHFKTDILPGIGGMQQLVDVQTHSTPHNGTCSIIADTKCLVKHFLTNILTFFKNTVQ